jgi:hypothetical protein
MNSRSTTWIILAAIGGILVYLWYKKSPAAAGAPGLRPCTRLVRKPGVGARQSPLLCTLAKLLGQKKCSSPKSGGGSGGGAGPSHPGFGPAIGQRNCSKPVCLLSPAIVKCCQRSQSSVYGPIPPCAQPACPQCGIAGSCNLVVAAQCCQRVQSSVYGPCCGAGSVGGCFNCGGSLPLAPAGTVTSSVYGSCPSCTCKACHCAGGCGPSWWGGCGCSAGCSSVNFANCSF